MREIFVAALHLLLFSSIFPMDSLADGVTPSEAKQLRDEVREMFYHAFDGYLQHAFPLDELRPLTCRGEDSLGGYALTLIDSLDTLALLGDRERFGEAVEWVGRNVRFNIDKTVSVFETTIRVLGGLLSAHLIASDYATGMKLQSYDDELLRLAEDLAQRLLPAFDTPTGIPFGSVNLLRGVDENESKITSTAGGGTLTLEFGVLSRLTNNPIYEEVTKKAVRGIWVRRSKINLVGAHIQVFTGEWTQKDAGIGTSIDSFYEYLLKLAGLLAWASAGDINPAVRTHAAFFSVWKKYGFTPEGFNLASFSVQHGQKSYPLRPELIESTYWLFKATRDARYLDAGRDMLTSLQYGARCPCGYCHIADVETHKQDDHMESFFLAETVKYLWLLFDFAVGPDNLVENGPYKYIFSTEGHLLPATPEISLVSEHCSYLGAFCKGGRWKKHLPTDISSDYQETNDTQLHVDRDPYVSSLKAQDTFPITGVIKEKCPGLAHGQKFGISYIDEKYEAYEGKYTDNPKSQSHSVIIISNPATTHPINTDESDSSNIILVNNEDSGTLTPVTDEKSVEASSPKQMQQVEDAS